MKLYEISRTIEDVLDSGMVVDEETGEILFDKYNLEELEMALDEKMENVALYVKNLRAGIKSLKDEETALKARRKSAEHKLEWLEDYLKTFLLNAYNGEFETSKVALSTRKSKACVVDNENKVPYEYFKVVQDRQVDKVKLTEALKTGAKIPGAHLEERENLQVR